MLSSLDLAQAHEDGRRRWLPIDLPLDRYIDLCSQASVTLEALRVRPDDLYIAYAAALASPGAAEALDDAFVCRLGAAVRRVGTAPDAVPDVLQATRERLLTGARPRLAAYNGTVPLRNWIKLIAVRLAIDLARAGSATNRVDASFAAEPVAPATDPATLLAKTQFKASLETVLRDELARLPHDRRLAFRLHFIENQSIDAIARQFDVHRVTVARWLWSLGEHIRENLQRRFHTELGVAAPDFDSLVRVLRSTMSLDLRTLVDPP